MTSKTKEYVVHAMHLAAQAQAMKNVLVTGILNASTIGDIPEAIAERAQAIGYDETDGHGNPIITNVHGDECMFTHIAFVDTLSRIALLRTFFAGKGGVVVKHDTLGSAFANCPVLPKVVPQDFLGENIIFVHPVHEVVVQDRVGDGDDCVQVRFHGVLCGVESLIPLRCDKRWRIFDRASLAGVALTVKAQVAVKAL